MNVNPHHPRWATIAIALLMIAWAASAAARQDADRSRREQLNEAMIDLEQQGELAPIVDLPRAEPPAPESLPPASTGRLDGPTRYERVVDATAMVHVATKCPNCDNWHGGVATGFFVHPDGWLVTAAHALRNLEPGAHASVMLRDGRVLPLVAIAAIDAERDVALVRVKGEGFPSLPLSDANPRPGERVGVLSHPRGHHFMWTEGVVSRVLGAEHAPDSRLQITASFARGSSGAPVVDDRGNVVGVALSTTTIHADHEHEEGGEVSHTQPQMVVGKGVPVEDLRAALGAGRS